MDLLLEEFLALPARADDSLNVVADVLEGLHSVCDARVAGVVAYEAGPEPPLILFRAVEGARSSDWLPILAAEREWWTEFRVREVHLSDNLLRPERRESVAPAAADECFVAEAPGRALTAFTIGGHADESALRAALAALGPVIPSALARQRGRDEAVRAILGSLELGVLVVGDGSGVRYANATASDLLGLDATARDLGSIRTRSGVSLGPLVRAAQGSPSRVRTEAEGPFGPLRIEARALREASSVEGDAPVLVLLEDRSERRNLLRHQQEFLGTVGHELRTPLTSMGAALEILRADDAGASEEQRRLLDVCDRNVQRLRRLVEQLLDTADSVLGTVLLERQTHPLSRLLAPLAEDGSRRGLERRVGVDFAASPELTAWVDPARFVEAIDQLLDNALKFSPAGGHVRLEVSPQALTEPEVTSLASAVGIAPEGCRIDVVDEGPGMDARTRERALDPFYQDGDPAGARPAGAGLGLPLAAALTRAHGGRLELDSQPGRGTRASVWVPSEEGFARLLAALDALERQVLDRARAGLPARWLLVRFGPQPAQTGWIRVADEVFARIESTDVPPEADAAAPLDAAADAIGTLLAKLVDGRSDRPAPRT